MENISSIRDLINLWPTRADLASDIGKACHALKATTAQVHKWAETQSIPAKYHQAILFAAGERGFSITADLIVRLHHPASVVAA